MGQKRQRCPPPKSFRPAGEVLWAEFYRSTPSFVLSATEKKATGARAAGLRYERKAHEYLRDCFPGKYFSSRWVKFNSGGKDNYCQPDGIIEEQLAPDRGRITIVEIKLAHTSDAWWQIKELYYPVLRTLYGRGFEFRFLEVCKWFDPSTQFPERFEFVDEFLSFPPANFYVHVWKGR